VKGRGGVSHFASPSIFGVGMSRRYGPLDNYEKGQDMADKTKKKRKRKTKSNHKALLNEGGYAKLNYNLEPKVGTDAAAYLGRLIDLLDYWTDKCRLEDGMFYLTYNQMREKLSMSDHRQREARKTLEKYGLIETENRKTKDKQNRRYFQINLNKVREMCQSPPLKDLMEGVEKVDDPSSKKLGEGVKKLPSKKNIKEDHTKNSSFSPEKEPKKVGTHPASAGQVTPFPLIENKTGNDYWMNNDSVILEESSSIDDSSDAVQKSPNAEMAIPVNECSDGCKGESSAVQPTVLDFSRGKSRYDSVTSIKRCKDVGDIEQELFKTKWFDYRMLSPDDATLLFMDEWRKALTSYNEHNVPSYRGKDGKLHVMNGYTDVSKGYKSLNIEYLKTKKKTSWNLFTKLRQWADKQGFGYDKYWPSAFKAHEVLGFKNRLLNVFLNERIKAKVVERIDDYRQIKIKKAMSSAFKAENYEGTPLQDDYYEYLIDELKQRYPVRREEKLMKMVKEGEINKNFFKKYAAG
jgi:hypothetical protein